MEQIWFGIVIFGTFFIFLIQNKLVSNTPGTRVGPGSHNFFKNIYIFLHIPSSLIKNFNICQLRLQAAWLKVNVLHFNIDKMLDGMAPQMVF